ncbi:MAG: hypothetical protein HEQ23_16665 [Tepidisphaera sp.]
MQPLSRRAFVLSTSVLLAGCAAAPRASADVTLLSQPTVIDPARVGLGFFSSSHARPTRNFKRGDDFRLSASAELTRIRWWGLSEGRLFDDLRNFDQYTIELYEGVRDGSAQPLPGSLIWTAIFAPANLSITATGRVSSTSGAAEHLYEASLASPVTLDAHRDYILAVSARSINTRGDAWQWQDSEFFGGHGANYSYASARWSAFQDTDSAFELIGRTVPAPAAISLAGLALAWRTSRRARGA